MQHLPDLPRRLLDAPATLPEHALEINNNPPPPMIVLVCATIECGHRRGEQKERCSAKIVRDGVTGGQNRTGGKCKRRRGPVVVYVQGKHGEE